MPKPEFRLSEHDIEARLKRLPPEQAEALETALKSLGKAGESEPMAHFLLPMAETGLTAAQMRRLAEKVPPGLPLDHREMFYDFRLDRWIRHIEPPTLAECLDECVDHAESPAEGLAYAKRIWAEFLRRRGAS